MDGRQPATRQSTRTEGVGPLVPNKRVTLTRSVLPVARLAAHYGQCESVHVQQ